MPIADVYGVNQDISRPTYFVRDLMFACYVRAGSRGKISISIHDTKQFFTATWDLAAQQVTLSKSRQQQEEKALAKFSVSSRQGRFFFAICDQRLLLRIGDQRFRPVPFTRSIRSANPTSYPIEIAASSDARFKLTDMQVWRDLHYLNGLQQSTWTFRPNGRDQLIVLGDNVPISRDSRHWNRALNRSDLVGRVFR